MEDPSADGGKVEALAKAEKLLKQRRRPAAAIRAMREDQANLQREGGGLSDDRDSPQHGHAQADRRLHALCASWRDVGGHSGPWSKCCGEFICLMSLAGQTKMQN
ncbi:hypothetical protein [Bradyrhizobium yuanmingense]|uniref:hypothetical protein n=1 Tax=Bradyrhizobium yuanmingense TaxID=108015 RepID=UPI0023B8F027|nr:hypothetical protein [Bradyrhizobium yuanmingense]MDF0497278.1 hypothetical protein [Bradyrhizobium yuanmingense]